MRGTFEAMVEPPREQRGASIQNLDDVLADPERREVVEREQSGVGLH